MNLLVLDAVTKSLTCVLAAAKATVDPEFTVHYADATATTFTEGNAVGALNGTTIVSVLAAPAGSTRRVVKELTIYNKDTASITFILSLLVTATYYIITRVTLASLESWSLSDNNTTDSIDTTVTVAGGGRLTFTNADLVSGILTVTHGLALSSPFTIAEVITDNNNKYYIPSAITYFANTFTVDIASSTLEIGITGNWGVYYYNVNNNRISFGNADLVSGVLTITHNLKLYSPFNLTVVITDNNNKIIIPSAITYFANTFTVDIASSTLEIGITGNWGVHYL